MRGCQTVAVDVVDDEQVGLGRARALMRQVNVSFHTVIADGENLPFAHNYFDLVFCAATLHHATNLPKLLANIARVLRPGGRLVAINEPCIPDASDDEAVRQIPEMARELSYGINETRPRLDQYRAALRRAGLRTEIICPWQTYKLGLHDMTSWAAQLAILPPDRVPLTSGGLKSSKWLPWRFTHMNKRDVDQRRRQAWAEYVLRICGGAVILVGQKPKIRLPWLEEVVQRTGDTSSPSRTWWE
jgi:SAM-dependent methyltransferase